MAKPLPIPLNVDWSLLTTEIANKYGVTWSQAARWRKKALKQAVAEGGNRYTPTGPYSRISPAQFGKLRRKVGTLEFVAFHLQPILGGEIKPNTLSIYSLRTSPIPLEVVRGVRFLEANPPSVDDYDLEL